MSWRDLARQLRSDNRGGDDKDDRDKMPGQCPSVPVVPIVLEPLPKPTHLSCNGPAGWAAALAAIDPHQPPSGFPLGWWRTLHSDCLWLCGHHGEAAASLGWSAGDLFGVADRPGWGGLADRLEGARRVVLTETVGTWRGEGLAGRLWRETLPAIPAIWEIAK